ncbi:fungal specific transcription factor domain-containing protein [Aspergillus undulatus]|uniref:fungal specific transcription factor domain-containing protein n=1 Tax=Aspergillus undulatus TaxID=1810928 RepID=UPI003CCCF997
MTEWLDLAFYRLRIPAPYPPDASAQPGPSVSVSVSVPHSPPALPSGHEMRELGRTFLQTVCCIFPFLSDDEVYDLCGSDAARTFSEQALAYLIATTAFMEGDTQPAPAAYVSYCNTLFGHMVAERSLQSVQAILLLAIVLRSCDNIAWAWDVLCLGVSIAQSIGINQNQLSESHRSTWWCLYIFEKILAFESGRASMIWDRELSCLVPVNDEDPRKRYKHACISLANMVHELQDRAAGAWRREEWLPQTVDEAIEEKIRTGGELAILLEDWWESLPAEYRTGSFSQQSAFLSFYYHYALILLNRSVLLIETSEIREVIDRYASGKPWQHRLANGAGVCVEAARDMIKLTVAMVDSGQPTYLTALNSPLVAVYALAVHVLRERHSLLIRSDFELMKAAIKVISHHYRRLDDTQRVGEVLSSLETYIAECLDGDVPPAFGRSKSAESSPWSDRNLQLAWDPSALDWAGWDWNDLSHLLENSE